jgi:hypothetical protein
MASIVYSVPWTRQPQVPVRINRSHPLGARVITHQPLGLQGAVSKLANYYSGAQIQPSPVGRGLVGTGSAAAADIQSGPVDTAKDLTFSYWYKAVATTGTHKMIVESPDPDFTVGDMSIYMEGSSTNLQYGRQGAGLGYYYYRCPSPTVGKWVFVVASMDYQSLQPHQVYYDGIAQSMTYVATTGAATPNPGTLYILSRKNNQYFNDSGIQDLTIFNGYFSEAEAKVLTKNPWQIFAPLTRRIWVPSVGAAPSFIPNRSVVISQAVSRSAVI